jgi:hypothetical protein
LNLPGKNHVIDLREDSRVDIVETFLTRKFSYFANVNDIKEGVRPHVREQGKLPRMVT